MSKKTKPSMVKFERLDEEGRVITVVGSFDKNKNAISFGYSIKNPEDTQNDQLAITIAEGRSKKKPFALLAIDAERVTTKLASEIGVVLVNDLTHRLPAYVKIKSRTKIQPE